MQDYCVQNGLRKPEYMQYTRGYNFRHEVELEEGSFFGFQKQYPDDWSSRNAAAHMGLHVLLVYGKDAPHSFPGPFTLRRSNESLLARVPRVPALEDGGTSSPVLGPTNKGIKREATDDQVSSDGNHKKSRIRTRGRRGGQTKCKNANLLPLAESKIPDVETKPQEEKRKWNVTPEELLMRIQGLPTSCEKLESASFGSSNLSHFADECSHRSPSSMEETDRLLKKPAKSSPYKNPKSASNDPTAVSSNQPANTLQPHTSKATRSSLAPGPSAPPRASDSARPWPESRARVRWCGI